MTDTSSTFSPQSPSEIPANTVSESVLFDSQDQMLAALGSHDESLRAVERQFPQLDFHVRGNELSLRGEPEAAALVLRLFSEIRALVRQNTVVTAQTVEQLATMLSQGAAVNPVEVLTHDILTSRGRKVRPKTLNQKSYVDAIDQNTIVFGIGPAGTGKTYLAVAKAIQALQHKEVTKIVLTRPAVEAGERLGFLPGTLNDKIDPYLRPLYDALHTMIDPESIPRLMAAGTIEVAPLAYMRGRTLNDAFVILDEAQNTTTEQMKMFLTRLGFGSKMVVTGDVTQVDLPGGVRSGLRGARNILGDVDDIAFCQLEAVDVVRHRLVGSIVSAYAVWDEKLEQSKAQQNKRERTPLGSREKHGSVAAPSSENAEPGVE